MTPDYDSDVLDTLLVLNYLLGDPRIDQEVIIRGINFIVCHQNPDGSWSYVNGQPGNVLLGSKCVLLLNDFMIKTGLSSEGINICMTKAGEYLLSQQQQDKTWGTDEDLLPGTLLAYQAVLSTMGLESVATLEDTILGLQNPDGSWQNSFHTTLLAIQALSGKPGPSNVAISDLKLYKIVGEEKLESQNFGPYQNVVIEPTAQYDSTQAELLVVVVPPSRSPAAG